MEHQNNIDQATSPRKPAWPSVWLALASSLLLTSGCGTVNHADPNPTDAFVFPEEKGQVATPAAPPPAAKVTAPAAPTPAPSVSTPESFHLRVGELLTVSLSDLPPPGLLDQRVRIRDDGKITLPYNVSVVATGKTAGQLEEEIRREYVPRVFQQITVSVRPEERYYYVGNQVRNPNRYPYVGKITVLRAIDTASGFTEFANKKKIELRRSTGERYVIDYNKALKDMRYDLTVYPDDQIIVHRKFW